MFRTAISICHRMKSTAQQYELHGLNITITETKKGIINQIMIIMEAKSYRQRG